MAGNAVGERQCGKGISERKGKCASKSMFIFVKIHKITFALFF